MKAKRSSGFTLIEVLIAFTILTLVIGAVLRTLSSGLSHERTARMATARVLEARSILEQVGTEIPLQEGATEGRLTTGEAWRLVVSGFEPAEDKDLADKINAYIAELSVAGEDGRTLQLKTLYLGR